MVRISNGVITLVNFLTLMVSVCVMCVCAWMYVMGGSACERSARMPLLAVGAAVMVVSLVGMMGSCYRINFFMWLYVITLFLLIVGLTAFTIFTILVTNKVLGDALSRFGVENEKVGPFSWWLKNNLINPQNWDEVSSCMVTVKICPVIEDDIHDGFYKHNLSPIQSGCCKPPVYCGFKPVNGTAWEAPEKGPAVANPDCTTWSNEQSKLCFGCQSCKKAVVDNIRGEWKMLALINSCVLITITIIYTIACCALRNNQHDKKHRNRNRA